MHPRARHPTCSRVLDEEEKRAGMSPSPKGRSAPPSAAGVKRRADATPAVPASAAGRKKRREAGFQIALDLVEERVDVHNSTDKTLSLAGWKLKSETGAQEFAFPEGFELAAGATVVVWSGPVSSRAAGSCCCEGLGRHLPFHCCLPPPPPASAAPQEAKKRENPPTDLYWTRAFVWNNKGDSELLPHSDKRAWAIGLQALPHIRPPRSGHSHQCRGRGCVDCCRRRARLADRLACKG